MLTPTAETLGRWGGLVELLPPSERAANLFSLVRPARPAETRCACGPAGRRRDRPTSTTKFAASHLRCPRSPRVQQLPILRPLPILARKFLSPLSPRRPLACCSGFIRELRLEDEPQRARSSKNLPPSTRPRASRSLASPTTRPTRTPSSPPSAASPIH